MTLLAEWWAALGGTTEELPQVELSGEGTLPSAFAVTDLATGAVSVAAAAIAELMAKRCNTHAPVHVDRRLASMWFGFSIRPQGWELPPAWNAVAGDYATKDGWIRLHTNAPHRRKIALSVLHAAEDRNAVATAVSHWDAEELENEIVQFRGCAAAMRSIDEWRAHPQNGAVAAEPLVHLQRYRIASPATWTIDAARPLKGIRVLDLTRVRVAHTLTGMPAAETGAELAPEGPGDLSDEAEGTEWGPARRLRAPLTIAGTPMRWNRGSSSLGSSRPEW
jgi:crotonobetainyl-CoA:carnitine CoA-transferase CaiB-like acyl-CoA transferase